MERPDEVLRMVRLLAEIGYRELSKDANAQRLAVARRMSRDGIDDRVLMLLWEYAKASDSHGSPDRLFAWWLALPSRVVAKVGEMRTKNVWLKQALNRAESQEREEAAPVHSMAQWRKSQ